MQTTGLFTYTATTLTIQNADTKNIDLLELGATAPIRSITPGPNTVSVGAGVFQLVSENLVRVSADTGNLLILYVADKDKWPEIARLPAPLDTITPGDLEMFFGISKSFKL